jgi:hypothetical protein
VFGTSTAFEGGEPAQLSFKELGGGEASEPIEVRHWKLHGVTPVMEVKAS